MFVRQAGLGDLDALSILFDQYRQFYGSQADLAGAHSFLTNRLNNAESVAFIAFDERGEAVGFTQLYPSFSSVSMGRIYVLNDLFVHPSTRRSGVGKMLLDEAARFAHQAGAIRLSLSTARTNHAAQRLYEKLGWTKDEQFLYYDFTLPT